jgi:hypothetical protein
MTVLLLMRMPAIHTAAAPSDPKLTVDLGFYWQAKV